ncbi:MAG TPA: hypothetical protein DC000_11730 [Clostridiales bacterium]|nr:hypothetical protein [Clostridiales bacterium]
MRKDYYSITDIAIITGLSTRTIRTYIKNGLLSGAKKDGAWLFTEEDIGRCLNEQFVKESIRIKSNSLVRDFVDIKEKSVNSVCSIFDYKVNSDEEAELLCDKIIEQINSKHKLPDKGQDHGDIKFSFKYDNNINMARIILIGPTKLVTEMINKCLE